MTSDHEELPRARATFLEALDSEFRELASTAGLQLGGGRITAIAEQGVFVAATAGFGERDEDGLKVGLIHISTPNDLPLRTAEGAEFSPGSYVLHVRGNEYLVLRDAAGQAVAETAIPDAAPDLQKGGGTDPYYCGSPEGRQITITIRNGQICLEVSCPGLWIIILGCVSIAWLLGTAPTKI